MACVILVEVMTDEGINTCAAHRAAALLLNQDDGNQHMNYCLERDLVESPDLALRDGKFALLSGPGPGFQLNHDAVAPVRGQHERSASQ